MTRVLTTEKCVWCCYCLCYVELYQNMKNCNWASMMLEVETSLVSSTNRWISPFFHLVIFCRIFYCSAATYVSVHFCLPKYLLIVFRVLFWIALYSYMSWYNTQHLRTSSATRAKYVLTPMAKERGIICHPGGVWLRSCSSSRYLILPVVKLRCSVYVYCSSAPCAEYRV